MPPPPALPPNDDGGDQDSESLELQEDEYQWLQAQLAQLGELRIAEVESEDDDEWVDPTGRPC